NLEPVGGGELLVCEGAHGLGGHGRLGGAVVTVEHRHQRHGGAVVAGGELTPLCGALGVEQVGHVLGHVHQPGGEPVVVGAVGLVEAAGVGEHEVADRGRVRI